MKGVQIVYRVYYNILNRWIRMNPRPVQLPDQAGEGASLVLLRQSDKNSCFSPPATFVFLNQPCSFEAAYDWEYKEYGKLWTYNLHYFDWLNQGNMDPQIARQQMDSFIRYAMRGKHVTAWEPYPISLRLINWIKYFSTHTQQTSDQIAFIKIQSEHLARRLEYHLLGNHLMENGFGLLFAAYFIQNKKLFEKAVRLLQKQLKEQILDDGAHFELTPMYHQIILYRILDSINLMQHNKNVFSHDILLAQFHTVASAMLAWLRDFYPKSGKIPHFNDSVAGVAPDYSTLLQYAAELNIEAAYPYRGLQNSGYRKLTRHGHEILIDAAQAGPDYIPGHAHSDMLSFEWYYKGEPVIVNPGISTYEKNALREKERSTANHNTALLACGEQSETWGGFRLARRSRVNIEQEDTNSLEAIAYHWNKRDFHKRKWTIQDNGDILIQDKFTCPATVYFHFHPDIALNLSSNTLTGANFKMTISSGDVLLQENRYCLGYNKTLPCNTLLIRSDNQVEILISS